MARPKLKPDDRKSHVVRIRVTQAELKKIARRAKDASSKNQTSWIRGRLLGED